MPNQWKPCPPAEVLKEHALKYFRQGVSMRKMLQLLKRHYNTDQFGLGYSTLKKYYAVWGLQGTKKQGHTLDTIDEPIQALRKTRPEVGAPELRHLLRTQLGMKVPKQLVLNYLNATERRAVLARKGKRFVRRQYFAPGVNYAWSMDQHDKMKKFGLRFHLCVEVCSSTLIWLVVYWTNSNPRWVTRQYLRAVNEHGMPLLTQSDLGSENFGVANAHSSLRQHNNPDLRGTLQHLFMHGHSNIKSEIEWKQFRARFSKAYEDLFSQELFVAYNPINALQKLLFRWLAIPWMQGELDIYRKHHNDTIKRADKHKSLPHGIPIDIFEHPEDYNKPQFSIPVSAEALNAAEQQWAPPDHPVFELVPPAFEEFITAIYQESGSPKVDYDNFWGIYKHMLALAQPRVRFYPAVQAVLEAHGNVQEGGENNDMPLMEYEHVAQLGVGDIPAPLIIEDNPQADVEGQFGILSNDNEEERQNGLLFSQDEMLDDEENGGPSDRTVNAYSDVALAAWLTDSEEEEVL